MKINKVIGCAAVLSLAFLLFSLPVVAQGTGTNINDLMGQRPANSYYQNSGNGAQTQGSSSVTSSAAASVLQQEPANKLMVVAPANATTPVVATQKSTSWKLYAILAVIFLVLAIILFLLGIKSQQKTIEAAMAEETTVTAEATAAKEPEEVIAPAESAEKSCPEPVEAKPKTKKAKKKKKSSNSKVKRHKKR